MKEKRAAHEGRGARTRGWKPSPNLLGYSTLVEEKPIAFVLDGVEGL